MEWNKSCLQECEVIDRYKINSYVNELLQKTNISMTQFYNGYITVVYKCKNPLELELLFIKNELFNFKKFLLFSKDFYDSMSYGLELDSDNFEDVKKEIIIILKEEIQEKIIQLKTAYEDINNE
ncbi:MAG: hypothetical protein ACM31H_00965 [Nitrososphaerales archaeon]